MLRVARLWGRITLWFLRVVARTEVEIRGLENIPEGPILIAAKHQSALETLALCTVFPRFAYVLKRELLLIPLVGWFFARGGMVAIDRSKGTRAMSLMNSAAAAAIKDGAQLIVFPEGTRRAPGAPPAYKQGISHLYTALNVPCVPIALNTGLFWSRNSFVRRPGKAIIDILPPIAPPAPRGVPGPDRGADRNRLERPDGKRPEGPRRGGLHGLVARGSGRRAAPLRRPPQGPSALWITSPAPIFRSWPQRP